jgi:hypothetical protein
VTTRETLLEDVLSTWVIRLSNQDYDEDRAVYKCEAGMDGGDCPGMGLVTLDVFYPEGSGGPEENEVRVVCEYCAMDLISEDVWWENQSG